MHFLTLDKLLPIESQKDLYIFWLSALAYRRGHKHLESELANYVFIKSNEARKNIRLSDTMDDINFEFAALETPASSSKEANKAWLHLETIVNKEFLKLVD